MSGDASKHLQRLLGSVVARLAHDLKNPLAVVLSNVRYLEEEIRTGDEADALQETEQSAELLQAMIDDAVDSLRIGAGAYALKTRRTALSELDEAVARRLRGRLGSRELSIELPAREISTDGDLLRRAFCALLEHVVRQAPPGDAVTVRGEIVARDDGGELLEIEIVDGGQIFDPARAPTFLVPDFSGRAQSPDHRSDRGLGLGFAGTALRALGAEVDVTPRADGQEGVRFFIALPLEARG